MQQSRPPTGHSFAIDQNIIDAARTGAIFALNLSGGKDSTMSAHAANDILSALGHPKDRRFCIHADLGRAEWKTTPETVEQHAREIGLPLHTVRREAGDMVARWEQRYAQGLDLYAEMKLARMRSPFSSAGLRFCTAELKRDVLHRHLSSAFPGETIVSVLGIRRQESPARAKTPVSKPDTKLSGKRGCTGLLWHPSVDITTDDVFRYHRENSLTLHEAYTRYNASRLSCAFCVIQSLPDMTISAGVPSNRDLYRHLVGMEASSGFSFQQGRWLADVAPHILGEALSAAITSAKSYAAERRRIEAGIPKDFIKAPKGERWPWRLPNSEEAEAIAAARRLNAEWTGHDFAFQTANDVRSEFSRIILGKS